MEGSWDKVIVSKRGLFSLDLKSVWSYKDLLYMFVKRDFISNYKQTILGPLWFFLQPLFQALMMTLVFGKIAGISSDGIPGVLFYLGGLTLWIYFADCLSKTSDTFIVNQNIIGKVYFPRLIIPLSIAVSGMLKLLVQLFLFFVVWAYYFYKGVNIQMNSFALLLPLLILTMGIMGLGFGLLITSLTTKYRDFKFLIQFGVQLFMYASPVVYPVSIVDAEYRFYIWLNPVSSIIETFKFGFTGKGIVEPWALVYTFCFTLVILCIGILSFNKVERNVMDNV